MNSIQILLIFENRLLGDGLKELLESWDYDVHILFNTQGLLKVLGHFKPHIILMESLHKKEEAIDVLKTIKSICELPVIFVENEDSIEHAVFIMKSGADDYFSQPVDIVRLKKVLENLVSRIDIIQVAQDLKSQLNTLKSLNGRLIGNTPKMLEIMDQVETCAPSDAAILVTGPSGTGKELVAKAIHDLSPRKNGPFIAINCSAIPDTLLESEIFGHEKGSFTGAIKRKEGCFELADNGTFFLDEITEMAPDLQSKLLRVLESRKFRRVGGTEEISSNVRIVAASNRNVQEAIAGGKFREDLFYRLNVFTIDLPPLKERTSDIPLLTQHFIDEINIKAGKNVMYADPEVFELLKSYDWPGNVRELKNVIERAVILCTGNTITKQQLPPNFSESQKQIGPVMTFEIGRSKIEDIERDVIIKTLEYYGGNKTEAAKILGLSLKTLYNKLNSNTQPGL